MFKTLIRLLYRARNIRQQRGIFYLIMRGFSFLYNILLWPHLPASGPIKLAGIPVAGYQRESDRIEYPGMVRHKRWFDSIVPWETPSNFDSSGYEKPLLRFLESQINTGDDVVIIGGGYGVSTVIAAESVGQSGSVRTYEGSVQRASLLDRTVSMNDMQHRCDTVHAIVQTNVEVIGNAQGADIIPASKLPKCDILELDCEGAELEILSELPDEYRPRGIVVETHSCFGAPESEIQDVLSRLGYEVVDRGIELEEKGIVVLSAVRVDKLDLS